MPNIKSAIKRVEVTDKKNAENKAMRSKINTYVRKFNDLLAENNTAEAEKVLRDVVSLLDSAAKENVIHKNNAARKQAHLSKLLDSAKNA